MILKHVEQKCTPFIYRSSGMLDQVGSQLILLHFQEQYTHILITQRPFRSRLLAQAIAVAFAFRNLWGVWYYVRVWGCASR